ncbi:MAG: hypothetical protein HY220_00260 [Candidatus Sungbacteria bacterium]|uniref:SGNH hydrolase-type esterase domain-containing protein n=1 Tax=Candidatus Sungiibacteriota bacterium TaxID=2750080 RepID=A0A9D6LT30_9BACT|nr:hypothetical protein [Candidatus Sungbacteria bacterium]
MSRRAFYWLLIVLLTAAGYWFFTRRHFMADRPTRGGTIVAFGDSLTEGVGATSGHDYVSVLARRIGMPIINAGRSGDTTATALGRLESDVLDKNPKIVILFLGGNDAIRSRPVAETFANLKDMIEMIHRHGSAVMLIGIHVGLSASTYDTNFADLAEREKTSFVPNILGGILGHDNLMSDGIHPDDQGYRIVADRIEPILMEMLK